MRQDIAAAAERILAGVGIVVLLPAELFATLLCGISGEGIFYTQERIGKGGKPFRLYKFRTMRRGAPELPRDQLPSPEQYYIFGGRFLRSTGMDELPQLFCVLRGEMELVGPRPLLPAEMQMHRLRERAGVYDLRPGITGLAQLCGDPPLRVKAELDAIYRRERSLLLDGGILLSTLLLLCRRQKEKENITSPKSRKKLINLSKKACNFLQNVV